MYVKPRDVYDLLQLSRAVYDKELNDGNSVSGGDTIDLENQNIIEDGVFADEDTDPSNDQTIKLVIGGTIQDPADYTVNLREGTVEYNGTDTGTAEATYFYTDERIPSSVVSKKIRSATETIDNRTNTTFNGLERVTDEVYVGTGYSEQAYRLDKRPVRDIEKVEVNDAERSEQDNWTEVSSDGGNEYVEDGRVGLAFIGNDLWPKDRRRALRVTYTYGFAELPDSIKNLCLSYVGDELLDFQVVASNVKGRDNFDPETTEVLEMSKQEVIDQYRVDTYTTADAPVQKQGSISSV
jgi:hypothetical protein